MKEFFGFGGYQRPVEGFFSWQHLLFVSVFVLVMIIFATILGIKYRYKSFTEKNKVLIVCAISINIIELSKIIIICIRSHDPFAWRYELPLFLCSIQLITIPIAAFYNGKFKESALDFIAIFGLLGAILGTYCAGNNYSSYPVLSFDNVNSALTHCISGFTALFIIITNMTSMKKQNILNIFILLTIFCVLAYCINILIDYNYMFLMRGDGTPYDILFNLVNGNKILYPILVVFLFYIYVLCFYFAFKKTKFFKSKKIKAS